MCVCESDGSFRFICLAQFHIQCLDGLHRPVTSRAPNPAQALTKKVREKKREHNPRCPLTQRWRKLPDMAARWGGDNRKSLGVT